MKKYLIIIFLLILVGSLSSCDIFRTTTTTTETTNITTAETTTGITMTSATTETTTLPEEISAVLNAGVDTVEINTIWTDLGAKLVVNGSEYNMVTTDTVDTSSLGLYTINYTYTYEDTEYTVSRYVMVTDQTAPEITLNLGIDTVKVNSSWIDAGVSIIDNSGETLTAVITGTVDITTVGTYQITYTATDSSGNVSSIIRYVTVIE